MLFRILNTQQQFYSVTFWFVMGIGFIATGLSIIAFLPQSFKIIKNKKTSGISVITFFLYTFANIIWFIWGILNLITIINPDIITLLKNLIIIIANIPCAIWAGAILGIKIHNMYKYGEDCKIWKGKSNLKNHKVNKLNI
ncbi:MAG: SemiSWEET family sugar transporter [Spiroplasma sp.]